MAAAILTSSDGAWGSVDWATAAAVGFSVIQPVMVRRPTRRGASRRLQHPHAAPVAAYEPEDDVDREREQGGAAPQGRKQQEWQFSEVSPTMDEEAQGEVGGRGARRNA